MLSKLRLIRHDPRRYGPLLGRYVLSLPQRALAFLFAPTGLFVQEQMDIHPRSTWRDAAFIEATGGFCVPGDPVQRRIVNLEPRDLVRRDMLVLLLRDLVVRAVPGELAEVGVYRGRTARLLHHYMPERRLHLFDTFEGFAPVDVAAEQHVTGRHETPVHYADTRAARVLETVGGADGHVAVHAGVFPDSFPDALADTRFAFVHLDLDLYAPTRAGLELFYDRLAPGGHLVVHDYNAWPGPRRAVDEFFAGKPETPIPMPDKNGSVVITRSNNGVL